MHRTVPERHARHGCNIQQTSQAMKQPWVLTALRQPVRGRYARVLDAHSGLQAQNLRP